MRARARLTPFLPIRRARSYAFATAAAVETWGAIRAGSTSPPDSLSAQQMLDCSGNSGCAGGTIPATLAYAAASGLCAARDYAYVGYQTACRACSAVIKPGSFVHVDCCSDAALEAAVRESPVVVAICSTGQAFQSCELAPRPKAGRAQSAPALAPVRETMALLAHKVSSSHLRVSARCSAPPCADGGGVLTGPCCTNVDHAVTIVGFGKDATTGLKFWLAKNS